MKEKRNNGIVVLVIVLIILVLGLGSYIVYDKIISQGKDNNNVSDNNAVEEHNIKIDSSLDYVYDANYKYDNKYTSFVRPNSMSDGTTQKISRGIEVEYTEGTQYLSNLKVPFININSSDATKVNSQLESLYLDYAKSFDMCAEDKEIGCTQILTYRVYQFNNILSVVVIDSSQATSKWVLHYNTFTFDLTNGNLLNYSGSLDKLGYNYNDTLKKIELLLKEKMDEIYIKDIDLSNSCDCEYTEDGAKNCGSCYEKANKLFEDSIGNNEVLFFVNNNGNLNVLPITYADFVQDGTVNRYLIEVTK